jgi:plasmid stability protein
MMYFISCFKTQSNPSALEIIDMLKACKYFYNMKMIQIRNVPDELHRRLKARAALEGTSLSEYLRSQIQAVAERPTILELRQRLESRSRVRSSESAAEAIRAERDSR